MKLNDLPDQVRSKVAVDDNGCWVWTAYRNQGGYGQLRVRRKAWLAHRYVYHLANGIPPDEMPDTLDHLCRNRACVNPVHLEPCARGENVLRGMHPTSVAWRNGTCVRGHTDLYRVEGRGVVQCRECRRQRRRKVAVQCA